MFAASCQNDAIVETSAVQEGGELFTLEVNKGMDSRTTLNGTNTYWAAGDQLYVCGRSGQVTGVLTLKDGAGTASGTFEGYIKGGSSKDLQHVVFPAPKNNQIDMSQRGNGLNVPMIGKMENGAISGSLKNVGGIVMFESDRQFPSRALDTDGKNLSAGSYIFNPADGTLTYKEGSDGMFIGAYVNEGKAYLPVATTFSPISANGNATTINVTVEVNVDGTLVSAAGLSVKSGTIYGDEDSENTDALDVKTIADETALQEAFANGGTYILTKDLNIKETLTLEQGITLNLNLNGVELKLESKRGIDNHGNLTMTNGHIVFKSTLNDIAVVGIYNGKRLTLKNVDVTSDGYCVYSEGEPWNPAPLAQQGEATVTVDITKGEFTSDVTEEEHKTAGRHVYAIYTIYNSTLTMNGATVLGHGGIGVDVSYGYLYGVKATATCKTGAKGLYVPAGIVEHDGECEFNTQVAETYSDWGTGSITNIDAE